MAIATEIIIIYFFIQQLATNTNFIVFGLTRPWLEPRSSSLDASTLNITPPMW
jgi:hypothetical protein